jgi:hypothetical protein
MRTARAFVLMMTAAGLLATASASAQTDKPAGSPDQAAAMEKMMAMMQPGPEHQQLAKLVGKWSSVNKMWMDPAAPPMELTGVMEYVSVMGGRYLHGTYKSVMMGMPFEGMSVDGYDRYKKEYFSLWFDNMGTGFIDMRGTRSPDGRTTVMKGLMFNPQLGKDSPVRSVTTWIDDNTIRYEMFETKDGKEARSMEVTYKRM